MAHFRRLTLASFAVAAVLLSRAPDFTNINKNIPGHYLNHTDPPKKVGSVYSKPSRFFQSVILESIPFGFEYAHAQGVPMGSEGQVNREVITQAVTALRNLVNGTGTKSVFDRAYGRVPEAALRDFVRDALADSVVGPALRAHRAAGGSNSISEFANSIRRREVVPVPAGGEESGIRVRRRPAAGTRPVREAEEARSAREAARAAAARAELSTFQINDVDQLTTAVGRLAPARRAFYDPVAEWVANRVRDGYKIADLENFVTYLAGLSAGQRNAGNLNTALMAGGLDQHMRFDPQEVATGFLAGNYRRALSTLMLDANHAIGSAYSAQQLSTHNAVEQDRIKTLEMILKGIKEGSGSGPSTRFLRDAVTGVLGVRGQIVPDGALSREEVAAIGALQNAMRARAASPDGSVYLGDLRYENLEPASIFTDTTRGQFTLQTATALGILFARSRLDDRWIDQLPEAQRRRADAAARGAAPARAAAGPQRAIPASVIMDHINGGDLERAIVFSGVLQTPIGRGRAGDAQETQRVMAVQQMYNGLLTERSGGFAAWLRVRVATYQTAPVDDDGRPQQLPVNGNADAALRDATRAMQDYLVATIQVNTDYMTAMSRFNAFILNNDNATRIHFNYADSVRSQLRRRSGGIIPNDGNVDVRTMGAYVIYMQGRGARFTLPTVDDFATAAIEAGAAAVDTAPPLPADEVERIRRRGL